MENTKYYYNGELMDLGHIPNSARLVATITEKFYASPEIIDRNNQVRNAILMAVDNGGSWDTIMEYVNKIYIPKNWLTEVRSILQGLLNDREIYRDSDVYKEIYHRHNDTTRKTASIPSRT